MISTNFGPDDLITALQEIRGTLDKTPLLLCSIHYGRTNGKRDQTPLHSLELEN